MILMMRSRRLTLSTIAPPSLFPAALLAAVALGCEPLPSKTAAQAPEAEPPAQAAAPADPHAADREAARKSARQWLSLIDQSQYGESWDAAAPLFQSLLTREKWESAVAQARRPLGSLSSRKFRAAEYKDEVPGAPAGEYVVVYYDTAFADKPAATESVTLRKTVDSSWKAAGYFVQ